MSGCHATTCRMQGLRAYPSTDLLGLIKLELLIVSCQNLYQKILSKFWKYPKSKIEHVGSTQNWILNRTHVFDFWFGPKKIFLLKFATKISRSAPQNFIWPKTSIWNFVIKWPWMAQTGLLVFRPQILPDWWCTIHIRKKGVLSFP